mmetsp:Transcript_13850/g.31178  ORF Transcript_13850/g.31178 Transcript_13850/m.31178 type:complete len:357 (+) Transcript_13850:101-1171(+)
MSSVQLQRLLLELIGLTQQLQRHCLEFLSGQGVNSRATQAVRSPIAVLAPFQTALNAQSLATLHSRHPSQRSRCGFYWRPGGVIRVRHLLHLGLLPIRTAHIHSRTTIPLIDRASPSPSLDVPVRGRRPHPFRSGPQKRRQRRHGSLLQHGRVLRPNHPRRLARPSRHLECRILRPDHPGRPARPRRYQGRQVLRPDPPRRLTRPRHKQGLSHPSLPDRCAVGNRPSAWYFSANWGGILRRVPTRPLPPALGGRGHGAPSFGPSSGKKCRGDGHVRGGLACGPWALGAGGCVRDAGASTQWRRSRWGEPAGPACVLLAGGGAGGRCGGTATSMSFPEGAKCPLLTSASRVIRTTRD